MKSLSQPDAWSGAFGQVEADPAGDQSGYDGDGGFLASTDRLVAVAGFEALESPNSNFRSGGKVLLRPVEKDSRSLDLEN